MNPDSAIDLARDAVRLCLIVGGPIVAVALVVGLFSGVLQAATQIHEQSLSLVPKLIAVAIAVMVALPWLIARLGEYATELITSIPHRL